MSGNADQSSPAAGSPVIHLLVNGDRREATAGITVAGLLAELGLGGRPVLVERNGEALFPRDFAAVMLGDGDRLEIVRMVAGG